MWEFEHSVQALVSRQRAWAVWTDVSGWPEWNPGVGYAELDGPLIEGATGIVHAAGGPRSTLKVLAIEPERRFVTEASERLMRSHTIGKRLQGSIPAALEALVSRVTTPADA